MSAQSSTACKFRPLHQGSIKAALASCPFVGVYGCLPVHVYYVQRLRVLYYEVSPRACSLLFSRSWT